VRDATARSRGGRPRRDQAGEVERRLLDAATAMFLAKGFDATTCEEVVSAAGAGKASLYARFENKEALFAAVLRRMAVTPPDAADRWAGAPLVERLRAVGLAILQDASQPETAAAMRLIIAAAPRFPEIAREAGRVGWDSGIARVRLAALAGPDSPGNVDALATRFVDLVFPPHQLRLLLGEEPQSLLAEAASRVDQALSELLSDVDTPHIGA